MHLGFGDSLSFHRANKPIYLDATVLECAQLVSVLGKNALLSL